MKRAAQALRRFPMARGDRTSRSSESHAFLAVGASLGVGGASLSTSSTSLPQKPRSKEPYVSMPASSDVQRAFFTLLRQRLCNPAHPLPARNVYDELANRSRVVEEFHFSKTNRRISHQCLALAFLRRYNVLLHSLLFFSENTQTWNTTSEFQRLALFGESILAAEVRGRLLKLFPDIPYSVLVQALPAIVGEEGLCFAFDRYDLKAIVGAKPQEKQRRGKFTAEQQCHMFCAVIGEMYWFVARTRPTDRTHNNALFPPSDVLILHVLCSHLLECIPAELIYRLLEPVIADMKRVWVNEPMSLPSQLRLVPRTIGTLSLNTVPVPNPSSTSFAAEARDTAFLNVRHKEAQSVRRALTSAPETTFVKSFMQPTCNHRNFDSPHYQILEKDDVMEKCVLSTTPRQRSQDGRRTFDSEAANIARAMELAKLAVQT
ncbi:putative mitochondrial MP44 [Leptomonas pyrrhocoris]|uniref:Putative mitochondrial MP44 n=1 Tax=Leptomonas pyrrhocoris TaxID=157538 RepID=A0A0M9FPZ2_LEPPY|nr:putative mitochondrial MP44 [Leptomonas pyrrhocoris]KPA73506.1 putative mitochondrial MP44 [Leptomonas pyrrhocoris]|eukprot:XP_015651945.1 putative mitochondrial MP44 [Leptomonas pyrrhocoris]